MRIRGRLMVRAVGTRLLFYFDFLEGLEREILASGMGWREELTSEGHGCEKK